ncbi:MAG: hypothetical protein RIR00_2414, partial [Pseudomonadota bacterium]
MPTAVSRLSLKIKLTLTAVLLGTGLLLLQAVFQYF